MGSSIQYPNCETPSDSGVFPHPHLPPGGEGVHSTPQHKQQHLGRETGKGSPTLPPGGEAVPINTSTQKVESPHPTLPPWGRKRRKDNEGGEERTVSSPRDHSNMKVKRRQSRCGKPRSTGQEALLLEWSLFIPHLSHHPSLILSF